MSQPPPDDPPEPEEPPEPREPPHDPPPLPEPGAAIEAEELADLAPPQPKKDPGMGPGVGFGCLGMVVALLIGAFLLTTAYMSGRPGWVNLLPFIVVTLVGIGLLIPKKTRRIGVGFSIVSAASWLVIIGPCFVPGALTTY